jgi:hypothetical protein
MQFQVVEMTFFFAQFESNVTGRQFIYIMSELNVCYEAERLCSVN